MSSDDLRYLTELRDRVGVARDALNDELKKVPADFTKIAVYERQIVHLLEEIKTRGTDGEVLTWRSTPSKLSLAIYNRDPTRPGSKVTTVLPSPYYVPGSKYGVTNLAPSSAARYENYTNLQKGRTDAPFFLSGRPVSAKPPPFQLVHRVFGEFLAGAAGMQPSPDTFEFVLEMCAVLTNFHPDERIRQQLFNKRLEQYLGKPISGVKLASGISETDGSIVDKLDMPEIVHSKGLSTGTAADPSAELMAYHYCLVNRSAPQSRLPGSPCFGLVVTGCMLWICGLADVGRMALEPLTPMFHMLDMRPGQPAYMDQLARAFEALRQALDSLERQYQASSLAVHRPADLPYPLLVTSRWSQVQNLVDDKSLLFYASNIQSKEGKVIKYVTQYGSEVHQTLSDAGLAPTLYDVVQLPGGFVQVEMELLAEEDGWRVLSSLSPEDLLLVASAVWDALGKVHVLCLPGGGSPVLADCRACNVMVRNLHGPPEVRFLDFDWAGRAGEVRYPSFMNHQDNLWPPDIQDSAPALQRHDRSLLKRHLPMRPQSVMRKQPNMAWRSKHHFPQLVSLRTIARVCPCGRLG